LLTHLARKQGSAIRFFLTDLHEDVVGLSDTTGALTGTASYSPWGEKRTITGETAYLGFQGDPTDPDTGMVDMLSRWYDPSLGRFTTQDVLFGDPAEPMSLNQYVYTQDSSVSYTDPTGMVMTSGGGTECSGVTCNEGWAARTITSYCSTCNTPEVSNPSVLKPKPWENRGKNHVWKGYWKKRCGEHIQWCKKQAAETRRQNSKQAKGDFVLRGKGAPARSFSGTSRGGGAGSQVVDWLVGKGSNPWNRSGNERCRSQGASGRCSDGGIDTAVLVAGWAEMTLAGSFAHKWCQDQEGYVWQCHAALLVPETIGFAALGCALFNTFQNDRKPPRKHCPPEKRRGNN
jgi:RHS repeat-associated protein